MKKFEMGGLYQPAAQSQGFRAQQAPDITPLLRQNELTRREDQAAQERQRQIQDDFDRKNLDYLNQFTTKQAEDIASLSETFGKVLLKGQELIIKDEEEKGLLKAYTEGLSPEIRAAYDNQEVADKALDAHAKTVAAKAEADGAPTGVSKQLRNMSHWARKSYLKGMAEQAGAEYPLIKSQLAKQVSIDVEGRDEPLTLDNAKDEAEFAAVTAEINKRFISGLRGIPASVLEKTAFKHMKAVDKRDAITFAAKLKQDYKDQKIREFRNEVDTIIPGLNADSADFDVRFQELMEVIGRYKSDFGGAAQARQEFYKYYGLMFNDHKVNAEFNSRLTDAEREDAFQLLGHDKGLHKFAKLYRGEVTEMMAKRKAHQQDMEILQMEKEQFRKRVNEFDKQFAAEEKANGFPSDQRLLEMEYEMLAAGIPVYHVEQSSYLKTAKSASSRDAEYDLITLRDIILTQGGIERDTLDRYHPNAVRQIEQESADRITERDPLVDPNRADIKQRATALANTLKNEQGYRRGYSTVVLEQNMMADYDRIYAGYVLAKDLNPGTSQVVWDQVRKEAMEKDDQGNFTSKYFKDELPKPYTTVINAQATFKANNSRIDLSIPALVEHTKQLDGWTPGKGPLPPIWRRTAQTLKQLDGTYPTAWELANAQYAVNNDGAQLPKTAHQANVENMSTRHRQMLTYKASPGRYSRVAIESGWKPFLDLVADVESTTYGGYDAYNLGGSDYGHTAHGSGNSAVDNRFGKPISKLLLKDVLDLGAREKIHAAGRYQFVHATLKEVVQEMGLTGEEVFNEELQDSLAIHRALWRVRNGGKNVYNFGHEWIGLQRPSVRRELQVILDNLPTASPYNRVEYMHPTLLKRLHQ